MPTAESWSNARATFLKEVYPEKYKKMKADGTLKKHCQEVGQNAAEMYDDLHAEAMLSPDQPQNLHERVAFLEAIPERARELVNHEFIHTSL